MLKSSCALVLLLCVACGSVGRSWFLSSNAADIEKATKAIEGARERGLTHQKASNYEAAIADYEKSMEFSSFGGGCACQPDSPLASIYAEQKRYDKSWDVVRRARRSGRWIAPEVIDALKKASPLTDRSS